MTNTQKSLPIIRIHDPSKKTRPRGYWTRHPLLTNETKFKMFIDHNDGSPSNMAEELGLSRNSGTAIVSRALERMGLREYAGNVRTQSGRVWYDGQGYLKCNKNIFGWEKWREKRIRGTGVRVHQVIFEMGVVGCPITRASGFDVHHLDFSKDNFDPNNLVLLTRKQHRNAHCHPDWFSHSQLCALSEANIITLRTDVAIDRMKAGKEMYKKPDFKVAVQMYERFEYLVEKQGLSEKDKMAA